VVEGDQSAFSFGWLQVNVQGFHHYILDAVIRHWSREQAEKGRDERGKGDGDQN